MLKPNRNSDFMHLSNLETNPVAISTTALAIADAGTQAVPKCVLANVLTPELANSQSFYVHNHTAGAETFPRFFAVGVLVDGDMTFDQNYLLRVSGMMNAFFTGASAPVYTKVIPCIGRIAALHADIDDAENLTGVDYLPPTHYNEYATASEIERRIHTGVNAHVAVGNWDSTLSAYASTLPIFAGWLIGIDKASVAISVYFNGSIAIQKFMQPLEMYDPMKQ